MKTIFIIFFVVCCTIFCTAQKETREFRTNINEVEVSPPLFTGVRNIVYLENTGTNRFRDYIIANLDYVVDESTPEGTEVVSFVVTSTGQITDLKVVNSVSSDIDEEFIRVIKNTNGMWKPALKDGKYAAMPQEVSVTFSSNGDLNTTIETFKQRAENYFTKACINLYEKHNLRKAENMFDQAVRYLPHDCSTLLLRGICRYGRGNKDGAMEDWSRVKELGGINMAESYLAEDIKELDGYKELMTFLEE